MANRPACLRAKCFGPALGAVTAAVTSRGRTMARGVGAAGEAAAVCIAGAAGEAAAVCIGGAVSGAIGLAGPLSAELPGSDGGTGRDAARIVPTVPIATTGRNHRPKFMSRLAKSSR